MKVTSSLKPACGTWSVLTLDHDLNTQVPNGQWFTNASCYQPGTPIVAK